MYPLSTMLGIPVVCAGIGYMGARAHAPNEHVRLSDYWLGQKFIGEFIKAFAET
jgi:acetylornithine deacetylase/succinyl-diaminopimelate desuccinylase-like protein